MKEQGVERSHEKHPLNDFAFFVRPIQLDNTVVKSDSEGRSQKEGFQVRCTIILTVRGNGSDLQDRSVPRDTEV